MISRLLLNMLALVIVVLVAAGCGGDDKPAYCENVADLQVSVDDVKNVELTESGALSTLQAEVPQIRSDVSAVVSSAKQDFPSQTSALKSSVSELSTAIDRLPTSSTAQQLAPVVQEIRSVVTAAQDLGSATSSPCD